MQVIPYLSFPGQCREAFQFYARALGGRVGAVMTYGESPVRDQLPAENHHWVMHSQLELPGAVIMGADGPPRQDPPGAGAHINVMVDTPAEAERIFAALLEGGAASMPMQETFWAHRFGMLVDRFGTPWMVNCLKPM